MSERQHISRKSNTNPGTSTNIKFQSRPFTIQRVTDKNAPLTQQEIENQQYQQDRFEATKLEIQAKYGTITPEGQERLNLLQAKKAEFWQRYMGNTKHDQRDFSMIPVHRKEVSPIQAIQPKLTIGEPGDKYEQEADRVAAQVVNQINTPITQQSNQNLQREKMLEEDELMKKPKISSIQREVMPEEDDELQMKQTGDGGMAAPANLESSIQQARSGGQPLADNVKKPMERAFGADFSGVRVHTDSQADQLNQSIQARAFTTGQDVFFRQEEYNPGSRGGQELIAHELTHVVQQGGRTTSLNVSKTGDESHVQRSFGGELKEKTYISIHSELLAEYANVPKVWKIQNLASDNEVYETLAQVAAKLGLQKLAPLAPPAPQGSPPEQMAPLKMEDESSVIANAVEKDDKKTVTGNRKGPPVNRGKKDQALANLEQKRLEKRDGSTPQESPSKQIAPPPAPLKMEESSVVVKSVEKAHEEAVAAVRKALPLKRKEKPDQGREQAVVEAEPAAEAGPRGLIINYVWLGNSELRPLEKFNIYSWRALGHSVNIYTLRFDGKVAGHQDLGIEAGDATVIDLHTQLGEDETEKSEKSPKAILGDTRELLKAWIKAIPENGPSKEYIYNMVDVTKSYIGGTQRGIVLDMKVGPSEHLPEYAESFSKKFISYSRGGQATAGIENQSMGTMQESDELRMIYATQFNNSIKSNMGDLKEKPNDKWFNSITNYHGRAFLFKLKTLGLDVATQSPTGEKLTANQYKVSEPIMPGQGPFRVFKAASEQSNKSTKLTQDEQIGTLAAEVWKAQLADREDPDGFIEKARKAMKGIA